MNRFLSLTCVSAVLALMAWSCRTTPQPKGAIEMISVNGREIPKLHLEMVEDSATTIKLSEFFEDFRIIPLETKKECPIMNVKSAFTDHSVLVTTQQGILGACRVLEFGFDGKYIREFGRDGKGPGEHTGSDISELAWYPDKKEVVIEFFGSGNESQLFSDDGKFLHSIRIPVELTQGIKKFNDSIWMTAGEMAGNPDYRRDSFRLIFYRANGEELKVLPRTLYPQAGRRGYTPTGWGQSFYQYGGNWMIQSPGDDTLYQVGLGQLKPMAVFNLGPKGNPYNKWIEPASISGYYHIKLVSETSRQWIFIKSVTTKAELNEYKPGHWGGMFNINEFMITVDKETGLSGNLRFNDDFLGILSDTGPYRMIEWRNGQPFIVFMAPELKESIKKALKKDDLNPAIRTRLVQLDSQVIADSNPVILMMKVKGR